MRWGDKMQGLERAREADLAEAHKAHDATVSQLEAKLAEVQAEADARLEQQQKRHEAERASSRSVGVAEESALRSRLELAERRAITEVKAAEKVSSHPFPISLPCLSWATHSQLPTRNSQLPISSRSVELSSPQHAVPAPPTHAVPSREPRIHSAREASCCAPNAALANPSHHPRTPLTPPSHTPHTTRTPPSRHPRATLTTPSRRPRIPSHYPRTELAGA